MDSLFGWIASFGVVAGIVIAAEQYYDRKLKDAEYRRIKAEALRDPGFWRLYLRGLDGSLQWLQRHFGHPLSLRALGVCLRARPETHWRASRRRSRLIAAR
jgi:hypothetical protein